MNYFSKRSFNARYFVSFRAYENKYEIGVPYRTELEI